MTLGKIKFSKIAIVVSLTLLIWVWADLALDETFPVSGAMIIIDDSTAKHWVSIGGRASIAIDNLVLKGSASKIAEIRRKIRDRPPNTPNLEFFLDAEQEGMVEPNEYPNFDVRAFLGRSPQIRQSGLTVESCKPTNLTVKVVELFEKSLPVQCLDAGGNSLQHESIEPSTVSMFVPEGWGRNEPAWVTLTARQIEQARAAPVEATPYIDLPDGQRRKSRTVVKVKIRAQEDRLKSYPITTATLGYLLSANVQGKYKVEVGNMNEVIGAIKIRASEEAKQAYEQMSYQVRLEIDDGDTKSTETIRRELIYNFPPEFSRIDEIMLDQPPVAAQFKLIRLPSADNP
jgi:hypothetical protein